jgi:thymidylate synthase (FAD)
MKQVFKVTLEDGKSITSTKDHRFLTPDGWQRLEDALGGLSVSAGGLATAGRLGGELLVNGELAYRDRGWLEEQYVARGFTQESIAQMSGVSAQTVRAWVRKHGLQKPKGSWGRGRRPWNAGVRYTAGWSHAPETRAALSAAKQGALNPRWKGGITPVGQKLRGSVDALRADVLARDAHTCRLCGARGGRLSLHHVLPIWARPDLALDAENLATVCRTCHTQKLNGHELEYVERFGRSLSEVPVGARAPQGNGRLLVPRRRKIVSVEYVGERETYDIEMDGANHNFVANGIVTHNSQLSQRYVDESDAAFVVPPAIIGDDALMAAWQTQIESAQAAYIALVDKLMDRYKWVDDKVHRRKMAREAARGVLPNSTETKIVVTANARGWRTMLELRSSEGAEFEIRRMAVMVLRVMQAEAPAFFSDFETYMAPDRAEAARIAYHKV